MFRCRRFFSPQLAFQKDAPPGLGRILRLSPPDERGYNIENEIDSHEGSAAQPRCIACPRATTKSFAPAGVSCEYSSAMRQVSAKHTRCLPPPKQSVRRVRTLLWVMSSRMVGPETEALLKELECLPVLSCHVSRRIAWRIRLGRGPGPKTERLYWSTN